MTLRCLGWEYSRSFKDRITMVIIKLKSQSLSVKIFGWTLFLFGILAFLISLSFASFILIIPGLWGVFYSKGIQFNETANQFRKYQVAWGFKTGGWYALSKYNHIAITTRSQDKYGKIQNSDRTYSLRFRNNTKTEYVHITKLDSHADIVVLASKLAERLNLPIKDFTLN